MSVFIDPEMAAVLDAVLNTPEASRPRARRQRRVNLAASGLSPISPWPECGGVYFVRCGARIKIGHARNVAKRLAGLQVGAPERLELVAVAPGGVAEEAAFHARFRRQRAGGEWFEFDRELREFVRSIRAGGRQ